MTLGTVYIGKRLNYGLGEYQTSNVKLMQRVSNEIKALVLGLYSNFEISPIPLLRLQFR